MISAGDRPSFSVTNESRSMNSASILCASSLATVVLPQPMKPRMTIRRSIAKRVEGARDGLERKRPRLLLWFAPGAHASEDACAPVTSPPNQVIQKIPETRRRHILHPESPFHL